MRIHAAVGAAAAWIGLALQYAVFVRGNELGFGGATIRFISFFTILTNTLVACVLTAVLMGDRDRVRVLHQPCRAIGGRPRCSRI